MDTHDLECFTAAVECGSINRAAKRVFVSPQGLGKIIKKLEAELGASLFVRTTRGIEPTNEAHALYSSAKRLLEDFAALKAGVVESGSGLRRVVRPVFSYGAQTLLGIDAFRDFERMHPGVRVEVAELSDDQADAALRSGEAGLGVIAGPIDTLFYDARFLASARHVCVVPASHPLASRESVSYADLDGETVVLVGRQFKPFHNNMDRLIRADAVPERVIEVGEIHNVSQFASQGAGIGISIDFEALAHPYPDTVVLPFAEGDCLWNLFVVHPCSRVLDSLEVALADHLVSRMRERDAQ